MEHRLYYSILVLIRQDHRVNGKLYQYEDKLPTEETKERIKRLVRDQWPKVPEEITIEELEEIALEEVKKLVPQIFNPSTGRYE